MGLFDRVKKEPLNEIFKSYVRKDGGDILETAKLISNNDPEVVRAISAAVSDPINYIKSNSERYSARGIELDNKRYFKGIDSSELLQFAMIDELKERGFMCELSGGSSLEEFLRGLERLKNYGLLAEIVKTVKLDAKENIEAWGEEIGAALEKANGYNGAVLCFLDNTNDRYPLTIITWDTLSEVPLLLIPM